MIVLLYGVILLLVFYLLAKVCDDYFVDSLDKIADRLKMAPDVTGATFMAIGSSAPELFISMISLIKPGGHEAIGMGTIVGSAIFNILVIIGASAAVNKAILAWQPVVRDTVFYSLSIVTLIFAFEDGRIVVQEAILFVALYAIYIFAVLNWKKILPYQEKDPISAVKEKTKKIWWAKLTSPVKKSLDMLFPAPKHYVSVFIVSILFIAALSWALVESAIALATIMAVPPAIIGLTILAVGTSIPDLLSSVIVAKQGRGGMAISNSVGSNIFDILVGLGVPWAVILLIRGGEISVSTENLLSSVILLFATVLVIFFLLLIRQWKMGKKAGWFLIILYVFYLIWAISQV